MSSDSRKEMSRLKASLAAGLSDPDNGYVSIPLEDAMVIAAAFDRYLSGDAKSLDVAFGVARGKGAPKRGPTKRILQRGVRAMFKGKKSWTELASEIDLESEKGKTVDVRTLQREVARHRDYILREFADRLAKRKRETNGGE